MATTTDIIGEALAGRPPAQRKRLQELRALIRRTAESCDEVSELEECLKWGQPSFVPKPKGIGSTVRIDARGDGVSVYFICTTGLVEHFRELYPGAFDFIGNREIHFSPEEDFPEAELSHCVALALTYHKRKKQVRSPE
ncbi:DUF1801 domain-containing protein [Nisaea acidiphila]|uniref:DUF1801 domain-containing protein n=1 Tax=Nisaea acidiphila TaxID=1862145 RepID=A0A9J7ASG5_9PROT|nr:DUF1801 domain-containing protein [Nisaea acidiphila]UUX49810.1 DUF1801 domain-containing protein [Nisaea acidiphila]